MNNKSCPEFKVDMLLLNNTHTRKMAMSQPSSLKSVKQENNYEQPRFSSPSSSVGKKLEENNLLSISHECSTLHATGLSQLGSQ